ncbi:MAG: DUF6079 family protein [Pseudomonadota bacterium]
MGKTIKDVIDLAPVKLVIELSDTEKIPEDLTSSFVFTEEINNNLHLILKKINKAEGCGVFLKGNYGSGKSHFLSYLYLLLKNQQKFNHTILKKYSTIQQEIYNIKKISLVNYPAKMNLEKIVLENFAYQGEVENRDDIYSLLIKEPTIILIDELSEFLKSKASSASFNEDIRFLQFLGEYSFSKKLWVIASLQESIEETGYLSSGMFNRIKDRYPLRISLSTSHIEDIIDKRIVIKKSGSENVIRAVYNELMDYYPNFKFEYSEFKKTYPLHPFTVGFLSGLTPVFSQHRGIIHFVTEQANKIMGKPADTLITPEAIFDHFEDRIREIPEYSSFARIAYDYYKSHITEIFEDKKAQDLALDIIRIMILTEISPFEKRKNAGEIAEMLLKRISRLSDNINYEYIKEGVLDKLISQKMYISLEEKRYFVDPGLDEGVKARIKIKEYRDKFQDENILFNNICKNTDLSYLPLKDIIEGKKYYFTWQNSQREGVVAATYSNQLNQDLFKRLLNGLETRIDGYLLIMSPFSVDEKFIDTINETYTSCFKDLLLFWIPRKLSTYELDFLKEFFSKKVVSLEHPNLKEEIKKEEIEFKEIVKNIYYDGTIKSCSLSKIENLEQIGYIPLEKMLFHIFDKPLSNIHNKHHTIMPRIEYYSGRHLNYLYSEVIKKGKITFAEADKRSLTPYIKGLLEPLDLINIKGGQYFVACDPENEIISYILKMASAGRDLNFDELILSLRKGSWGLNVSQIYLLLSALIVSGYLVPYNKDEVVELDNYDILSSGSITQFKIGKKLPSQLLAYINVGNFIWGEVEAHPTDATKKNMFRDFNVTQKKYKTMLKELSVYAKRYEGYSIFKYLNINMPLLNKLSMFFNSFSSRISPNEGLEIVLSYFKENHNFSENLAYLDSLYSLFSEHFQMINKYYLYLKDLTLIIPDDLKNELDLLVLRIEEYLFLPTEKFNEIRDMWEDFYEKYKDYYIENHKTYYNNSIFGLKKNIKSCELSQMLNSISRHVPSVTFKYDWFEIESMLSKLPVACNENLAYQLFLSPKCSCGFKIGDQISRNALDFNELLNLGVTNFIKSLQVPSTKERLESYVTHMTTSDKRTIVENINSLISISPDSVSIALLYELLTENVLIEIENILKGKFKLVELKTADFLNLIEGKRFKYNEIKKHFFNWIGENEDAIIWFRNNDNKRKQLLLESFKRYGRKGEALAYKLETQNLEFDDSLSGDENLNKIGNDLSANEKLEIMSDLNLSVYELDKLFWLLNSEKIKFLKSKIREEIYYRLKGKIISDEILAKTSDDFLKDLLKLQTLMQDNYISKKPKEIFIDIIAPVTILLEKIKFEMSHNSLIDENILPSIMNNYSNLFNRFQKHKQPFADILKIDEIKIEIKDVLIIFDCLRYDLYNYLKEEFLKNGWKVKDSLYCISKPSTTLKFRETLNISEEEGYIGEKSYQMLKWAEKNIGKRKLMNFLNSDKDIKIIHFNFIDTKIHNSSLNIFPLYKIIKNEFTEGILPILKNIPAFTLMSDHGFIDTGQLKNRYSHGGNSLWELLLPYVHVSL